MFVRFDHPRTMNNMLDEILATDVMPMRNSFPAVDILEDEQQTVVMAELPGVKKEDVKITFENNVLTLSGERKPYEIPDAARVLRNEMRVREFSRSFEFGHDIAADRIAAEMTNGVLRVVLPKAEKAIARNINIK